MRDITLGDTFYHDFTTRKFSNGVPTVLAGSPVLSVLEENNATPITAGVSISVDRASVVGLNEATIVATGGNGYEAGKSYSIYISTGTVDSVSVVGEVVGQFTVGASAAAVDLANGTDGLGAIKTETAAILDDTDLIDDGTSGLAKIATDVAAILLDTDVIDDGTSGLVKIATDVAAILVDTGTTLPDTLGGLGGATGGSVSIETILDNTLTDTIDAGAAVNKGTSPATVGVPVTGHAFVAGQQVTLAGTTNYNSSFDVDSVTSNEVVIVSAFSAETFGASDTIVSSVKTVSFVGSVQAGTVVSTEALGGAIHDIDDVGDDIDLIYTFNVGAGREGTEIIFHGFVQGNADTLDIEVYDHIGTDWEILRTITGQNGVTNITLEVPLLLKHTGTTGLDTGRVYVRFAKNATTPSNLTIDQLLVEAINTGNLNAYEGGQIWIDTNASNENVVADVDGTSRRPVSTIAAAKTLSGSTGLGDFHVINGSSFTLAESTANESYFGDNWILALGGQACAGAHFEGCIVSGVQTGSGVSFQHGFAGTMTIADDCHFDEMGLHAGTITLSAGDITFERCYHDGSSLPILDFNTGNTTLHMHAYHGGVEVQNMDSSDILHIDGDGRLDINANCSGGVINIRGNWDINDSGSSTIARDDITNDVIAVLVDTGTTLDGRIPAALSSGNMKSDMLAISTSTAGADNLEASAEVIITGAAESGTLSTTVMTTDLTEATDDHFIGRTVIWTSGALLGQASDITDYLGSTGQLTYSTVTDAPSAGDSFVIV